MSEMLYVSLKLEADDAICHWSSRICCRIPVRVFHIAWNPSLC